MKKDKKNFFCCLSVKKGVTLVEIMIAMALLSIGILGMIGSFTYLNKGLQITKGRTLANNLAQEKIELLKNQSYYRILVTTETDTDTNFSPSITYDAYPNGVENISVGGIKFERRVYIRKVAENASGELTYINWNQLDTGLKEIAVYVSWREGNTWKKLALRNVRENPDRSYLSSSFSGIIDENIWGDKLEGVTVKALENPERSSISDVVGYYSFAIEPGSYTLRASKDGYFPVVSGCVSIEAGQVLPQDFTLTKIATGTITGTVYKNDHLLISQVVASTVMAAYNTDIEYVELFNPTTWTIDMNDIRLKYLGQSGDSADINEIKLNYIGGNTTISPKSYYLITNTYPTGFVYINNKLVIPNALYNTVNHPPCSYQSDLFPLNYEDCIRKNKAGAVMITDTSGNVIDGVGWSNEDIPKVAPWSEGTQIKLSTGMGSNFQLIRLSSVNLVGQTYGRAHDSNRNNIDFAYENHLLGTGEILYYPFREQDGAKTLISGALVEGAIIYADDGFSNSTVADSSGNFTLIDVATGSWTVYVSSGMSFISTGTFGGTSQGFVASMNVVLDSSTSLGYITGTVTDTDGNPINDIKVYSGGSQNSTDLNGRYTLGVDPGSMVVTANYQLDDSQYVEVSSMDVIVELGQLVTNVDFTLTQGGNLRGRVIVTGEVDPLPNTPVVVFKNGIASGDGISDEDGYFYINGVSSGAYEVELQLEAGESSDPSSYIGVMAASADIFIGTFTVSGAMGHIEGTVTSGGEVIDTGVLIYASTDTIASTPPTLNSTLRSGSVIYYAVSSNFDGTFGLPVRGGYTYNIYAWYTTWSGDTPTTERKEHENGDAVAIVAGQKVTKNFSW